MRALLWRAGLLFSLFFYPTVACTPDEWAALFHGTPPSRELAKQALDEVRERLSKILPVTELRFTERSSGDDEDPFPLRIRLRSNLSGRDNPLKDVRFSYRIEDGEFSYTIFVPEILRDAGLNQALVLDVLSRHPEIYTISGSLEKVNASSLLHSIATEAGTSEEARAGVKRAFKSPQSAEAMIIGLNEKLDGLREGNSVIQMRERILRGYREHTPSGRIREKLGFANVSNIDVSLTSEPEGFSAQIKATRGTQNTAALAISIVRTIGPEVERLALHPDGRLERTKLRPQ